MKNLKKLVAVSAAALTLAGVGATTANAAIVVGGVTYDPRNVQIENMSQAEYLAFIQDVAAQINNKAGQRNTLRDAVAVAEKVEAEAGAELADATADRNAVRAELDEAINTRRAASTRVDELTEVLRLVNRDFDAEKRVAAEVLADALAANEYAYNATVNELAASSQTAFNALEVAEQEEAAAQQAVNSYVVDAEAGNPWTAEEIAAADARLAAAQTALGVAQGNYSTAKANEKNGTTEAGRVKDGADVTANAQYDQTIRNINAAYTDAQNIYKQYGIQGDAQRALDNAEAALADAEANEAALRSELADAEARVVAANSAYETAYAALRNAQREYAALERHISELELALHQAVVDGNINSNDSLGTITEEEMATIERVRGINSKELEDQLAAAEKNLADLEKEQEDGVPGAEGPDTDEEGNPIPGGEGQESDDEESDDEEESDKDEDDKDGDKDHGKDKGKKDKKVSGQAELPETGESSSYAIFGAAALAVLAGVGLVAPSFKKEN